MGSRLIARTAWILATILAASTFLSIYRQPVGWLPGIAVTGLAVGAAFSPYNALLVIAGLGPLSATIFALLRTTPMGLDFGEAMVLAFLAGCCAGRVVHVRPLAVPPRFGWAAGLLLLLALASGVVAATIIRTEQPDRTLTDLTQDFIARDYFLRVTTIRSTMLFVQGVALMLMAADTCGGDRGRRDRLLRMMVVGAATAVFFNVMKIVTSAMMRPDPWSQFIHYLATARVNIHFPDLNAAGSYFGLMLFVAIGFVPVARITATAASALIAAGLWIAGSRTALAAPLLAGGTGFLLSAPSRRYRRALAFAVPALLVGIAVAGWKFYPQDRNYFTSTQAVGYRVLMGKIAIDVTLAHPVFGAGLGRLWELSNVYRNNAHNNFLQISAELGIPAALLFVLIGGLAVRVSWRDTERWGPARGLSMGLAVFFLTCMAGHPLLVSGAAYPFWMALGFAATSDRVLALSTRARRAGIAAMLVIALTLPLRMAGAIHDADVEHASVGFSTWQQRPDGSRYRWAGGKAWFFVAPQARSVRLPLRRGPLAPPAVEIRIFLDGIEANRVVLRQGDDERIVRLNLIRRATTPYARIDLETRVPGAQHPLDARSTEAAGILMVGRPVFEN